jgi:hypothetical protein
MDPGLGINRPPDPILKIRFALEGVYDTCAELAMVQRVPVDCVLRNHNLYNSLRKSEICFGEHFVLEWL